MAEETKQPASNPDDKGTGDKDFVDSSAKVKLGDGTETTVEELLKGNMRTSDYTKKTQEIADIVKKNDERTAYFKDNPALAELEQKVIEGEINPEAILNKGSDKPSGKAETETDYEEDALITRGDLKKMQADQDKKWDERDTKRQVDEGNRQYMNSVNAELDKHEEFENDIDRMTGERLVHNFVREQQSAGRVTSPHKLLVDATAHAIEVLKTRDESKLQTYLDKKAKEREMPAVSGSTPISSMSKDKKKEFMEGITGSADKFVKNMVEIDAIPDSNSSLDEMPDQDSPFG